MSRESQFESKLSKAIDVIGLKVQDGAITLVTGHYNLLRKWNSKFNLTSLERPEDIIDRLYMDSLLFLNDLPGDTDLLLDVGSGPGFPGMPLLAANQHMQLIIVEPRRKMCAFLSEVKYAFKDQLHFEIHNTRCDSFDFVEPNRERFPAIISKAFAPPGKALRMIAPLLKTGGIYATCINPDTPLDDASYRDWELISDNTHNLPLTGKLTRHLFFRWKTTG